MDEKDKNPLDISLLQSPPKRMTPYTQEEYKRELDEWVRSEKSQGRLRDVVLYSGDANPRGQGALVFPLQKDLRERILKRFFLEKLDTLSMLDAATHRYQVEGDPNWYGLGLIDYLKDDEFWKTLWKRDFTDQLQDIGDRIPSWIRSNHPNLQWRAYWIWTFFFRRTLCKMVISQLNQRNKTENIPTIYRMASRSDQDVDMLNEFGHVVRRKSIWDLQYVIRRDLRRDPSREMGDYFGALRRGNVRHGLPMVCGAMLRYFLLTNGRTEEYLRSKTFADKWSGSESVAIPQEFNARDSMQRDLWTFSGFTRPSNVNNRASTALVYASWYWQTTLAVHTPRQRALRPLSRLERDALHRSKKREREVRWVYYFKIPIRNPRRETDEFAGNPQRRIDMSHELRQLPLSPHTIDQDSTKIFLGEPIGCHACGRSRAPFRCKRYIRVHYCSKKCYYY